VIEQKVSRIIAKSSGENILKGTANLRISKTDKLTTR